ncbi:hypothetical protein C5Y96_25925 [Blastopirellula marina]|uniref:Uncharacterized protein n=1 Tax=Blastopirellula marina TaxID=124 RepID=A0A2S8F082_9BACT|nr:MULTISPECIES: hypothetical protein [Pirellulaceae]PQO25334.1 hypothetical protein C5Y96_25925 [Blastopirellula marina]RCS41767.1 hypothetical protein DTL36_25975 [Bremerella cremea]
MHRRTLIGMWGGYVLLVIVVVYGLLQTRQWVALTYNTPQATENWQKLTEELDQRQDRDHTSAIRPVQRSAEPPIKILFSKNFPTIVTWSLVILSILYWSVGIMIAGALRTPNHHPTSIGDDAPT